MPKFPLSLANSPVIPGKLFEIRWGLQFSALSNYIMDQSLRPYVSGTGLWSLVPKIKGRYLNLTKVAFDFKLTDLIKKRLDNHADFKQPGPR